MDVHKILAELRAERDHLGEAILALERVGLSTDAKRRGRPPKWVAEARKQMGAPKKRRGRPPKAAG